MIIRVVVAAQIFATAGRAQELKLTAVPDGLPAGEQKILQEKRAAIARESDALLQKRADYVTEFKGTKAATPRAAEARERRAELDAEAESLADEADDFTETVDIAVRIESLTAQIKETEKKLHGLGFKQDAEDFEQIKGMSSADMAKLKARLFFRLQSLVREKPEQAMQERFLKAVKNLKPGQESIMQKMLASKESGITDPVFLEWLRSFQPGKPKAALEADARVLIDFLKREKGLAAFFEKSESDTVEHQQEAAITLLSLVLPHPYVDELWEVAAGTYDVSEAWFYIAVLDMDTTELGAVTDGDLAAQKALIKQMEDLIKERAMMRDELEKFQAF